MRRPASDGVVPQIAQAQASGDDTSDLESKLAAEQYVPYIVMDGPCADGIAGRSLLRTSPQMWPTTARHRKVLPKSTSFGDSRFSAVPYFFVFDIHSEYIWIWDGTSSYPSVTTLCDMLAPSSQKGMYCSVASVLVYIVAPSPSFVFFIFATNGISKPPDRPILSPSAQPILASMRNPIFDSLILGAA